MIATGCFACDGVASDIILKEITNPFWNDELEETRKAYDDASVFLQGSCQLFAYALKEEFGYKVLKMQNLKGVGMHFFCCTEISGLLAFVDVRGTTTNWNDFINGCKFVDKFENEIKQPSKEEVRQDMAEIGAEFGYNFAKYIIHSFPNLYDKRLIKGE